jgi:putative flippase GtrA
MLKDFFTKKSNNGLLQLARYFLVGAISASADFASLFVLTEYAHLHYIISGFVGFLLGLTTNYFLCLLWVFAENRTPRKKRVEFLLFVVIGAVSLVLNLILMWFFTEKFNLHYIFSKVVSTVIVFLWNFFSRKLLLWNQKPELETATN